MRISVLSLISSTFALSCASGPSPRSLVRPSDVVVIGSQSSPSAGCREVGLLAVTDGALQLSDSCSCAHPETVVGSEAGATALAVVSAARMGANTVWVLTVVRTDAVRTHTELCCSVTGYRLYAVAFACPPAASRPVDQADQPPPSPQSPSNPGMQWTRFARH